MKKYISFILCICLLLIPCLVNSFTYVNTNKRNYVEVGSITGPFQSVYRIGFDGFSVSFANEVATIAVSGVASSTGTANYLSKWVDSNTLGDSVIYESDSQLAIGHTNPNASIDILIPSASATGIMIKGADTQTGDYLQIKDPNDVELFVIEASGNVQIKSDLNQLQNVLNIGNGTYGTFVGNFTSNGFIPLVSLRSKGANNDVRIRAVIDQADDTGTQPAMLFQTAKSTNEKLSNRNLFEWHNWTTDIMSINESGKVIIGASSTPDDRLDIQDPDGPQLRLTHTDNTDYARFQVDSDGDLTITTSGGDILFNDENLATTGTFGAAAITSTLSVAADVGISIQGDSNHAADLVNARVGDTEVFSIKESGAIKISDRAVFQYQNDFGAEGVWTRTYDSEADRKWKFGISGNDLILSYYDSGWQTHSTFERPAGIVATSDVNWRIDTEFGDYVIYYYDSDSPAWHEHSRFSKPSGVKSLYGISNWSLRFDDTLSFYYWDLNNLAWMAHSTFTTP